MKNRYLAFLLIATLGAFTTGCDNAQQNSEDSVALVTTTEQSSEDTTTTQSTEDTTTTASTTTVVKESFSLENLQVLQVTSEQLQDNVWEEVISNTALGENCSPQLTWDAAEGAGVYAVYMLDESESNFIHLKTCGIKETSLAAGAVPEYGEKNNRYIGPYPPSGTHDYVIYVYALRDEPKEYPGAVKSTGRDALTLGEILDMSANGESGNVLAYGKLAGTYTKKELES